jgi:hypothetical protein
VQIKFTRFESEKLYASFNPDDDGVPLLELFEAFVDFSCDVES